MGREQTVRDVYFGMTDDQRAVLHYMIGEALKSGRNDLALPPPNRRLTKRSKLSVVVSAIELRFVGDEEIQVLIEVNGVWKPIITHAKEDGDIHSHRVKTDGVSEIHTIT